MRRYFVTSLVFVHVALITATSWGTTRFYRDLEAHSPNGRYLVEAKSPANRGNRGGGFQANFTYRCIDTKTKQAMWTRRQLMVAPAGKNGPPTGVPQEGSPVGLFVDDSGWVVIRTGWGMLIAVDPTGKDCWKIRVLSNLMSSEDEQKYVRHSSAGPLWSGYSMWYFVDSGSWFYDMDADQPFTLDLHWGRKGLGEIKRHTPPYWKTDRWDEELAF